MQQNMMGQNIIITEPSSNLRALGRNALTGKWKLAIMAVIVYELCVQVPPAILNALFGVNLGDLYFNYGYNGYYNYSYMYDSMPSYSFLSGVYLILVTGAFTLGITLFFLALFRRQLVGVSDIFLGFERFGKALGLAVFQGVFILLWSLLFIVPGIIAAIRYSQAFFILADNPNKGIRECMDESKRMMKGNKGKYFCLTISFIGWMLLASIPAGILESIASIFYLSSFAQAIITIIGSLFVVPVTAYMYSTYAGFYEILAGHLIKETEPAPIEPKPIHAYGEPKVEPYVPQETHEDHKTADNAAPQRPQGEAAPQGQAAAPKETRTVDVANVFAEADADKSQGVNEDKKDQFIPEEIDK